MVWEYEIEAIVMLTKCVEMTRVSQPSYSYLVSVCRSPTVPQEKSAQYWPESLSETITPGDRLSVTLSSSTPYAEYHVRKLLVKHVCDCFCVLHFLCAYISLIPCFYSFCSRAYVHNTKLWAIIDGVHLRVCHLHCRPVY